ncbi:MAG: HAD family hydrolase [Deltaproteobacteria bacterium]|nr:HAD family hydrolase [Nannocystaceae bacterium]
MRAGADRPVFLDRDGVLIADVGPLTSAADIRVLPGVAEALGMLQDAGFALVVVSNQTVVARGLLDEDEVRTLHREVERALAEAGAPALDGFYFCPHHPEADRVDLRGACECRKPAPGLIAQACAEHGFDARRGVMVGDRPSDVVAGARAGCRTVWVETGRHHDAPIVVPGGFEAATPDHRCADLLAAARWIVQVQA